MKLARLLLRLTIGGLFIGHGTQKLFGWFGGHGLDGTGQFFDSLGMRPGRRNALAAGLAEAGGGAALAAGFQTPLAAAALTGTMLTAVHRVHLKNGVWVSDGGFEYNLVLILAALSLAEDPGALALSQRRGTGWALFAAAAGAAGALGAHLAVEAAGGSTDEGPAQAGDPASPSANGVQEPAAAGA